MELFIYRITGLEGFYAIRSYKSKCHSSDTTSQKKFDEVLKIGNECILYGVITNQPL